jgi:hypothetical protein
LRRCRLAYDRSNRPTTRRGEQRTVLAIPSINLDQELLVRHREDLAAQEERCLYLAFALRRPRVRLVVVTCLPVRDEVVDYYLGLIPAEDARASYPPAQLRGRLRGRSRRRSSSARSYWLGCGS